MFPEYSLYLACPSKHTPDSYFPDKLCQAFEVLKHLFLRSSMLFSNNEVFILIDSHQICRKVRVISSALRGKVRAFILTGCHKVRVNFTKSCIKVRDKFLNNSTGLVRSSMQKINQAGGQQAVADIIWETLNSLGLK